MGIISIKTEQAGMVGVKPNTIYIDTDDTFAAITTTGYLNNAVQNGYKFDNKEMALVTSSDSGTSWLEVSISGSNTSLVAAINPGVVTLPVVDGDFSVFDGTTGLMKDAGYSPSDATKTKVIMANAAVIANHIATYTDTAGTLADDAATAINGGNIQAGLSGTAGTLASFPTTAAKGSLVLSAVDNTGDTLTTISNAAMGQASVMSIPDPGVAAATFMVSALSAADVSSNLFRFNVTIGQAALATAGTVTLVASSGAKQYRILSMRMNAGGTNFSGGGGDRLLAITDGTSVWSVIPAADIQTLANVPWGIGTSFPVPASVDLDQSSAAGASIVAQYSGGATDYTAGSVVISGLIERIA